jgi:hypothetical protein
LSAEAAKEDKKDAIKELFDESDDFDEQGESILKFLVDKRDRNDESLKIKLTKFDSALDEFKDKCHFDKEEDNYLASIRKGDLEKLAEHEQFLEVCQLAVKYYKELFVTSHTEDAVEEAFVLATLNEIKEDKRKAVQDTRRFASAQSQQMDE